MVEWPVEGSFTAPARWQYPAGMGQGSPLYVLCTYIINTGCCFSHSQDSLVQNQVGDNYKELVHAILETSKSQDLECKLSGGNSGELMA